MAGWGGAEIHARVCRLMHGERLITATTKVLMQRPESGPTSKKESSRSKLRTVCSDGDLGCGYCPLPSRLFAGVGVVTRHIAYTPALVRNVSSP